jgi:outer membrane protein OmpA-like peptidoglycan-associated protein
MSNHNSSYNFWTWLVAILLALILLWALFTGRGTGTCCTAPVATPMEELMPAAPAAVAPEAFSFAGSCSDFTSTGDATGFAWVSSPDALKSVLCGGEGLAANGDGKNVVLTGVVDSDATKQKIGADAQAFFGADVAIDNQITVKAAELVAMEAPPAAKLYFDTGKTALKEEADASLAPIIAWLNAHPESKAVISGFHDPRGNLKANEDLAYNRAKAAQAALITAGIDVLRIEFVKPEATDGGGDLNEARRVEVSIK